MGAAPPLLDPARQRFRETVMVQAGKPPSARAKGGGGSVMIAAPTAAAAPASYMVDRTSLTMQLEEAVDALAAVNSSSGRSSSGGGGIELRYETALQAIDFDRREVVAVRQRQQQQQKAGAAGGGHGGTEQQEEEEVLAFDLLVGADGANSRTRQLMQVRGVEQCQPGLGARKPWCRVGPHPTGPPWVHMP